MAETSKAPADAPRAVMVGVSGFGLRRALESAVAETERVGLIDRNACTDDLRDEVVGRCSANHPDVPDRSTILTYGSTWHILSSFFYSVSQCAVRSKFWQLYTVIGYSILVCFSISDCDRRGGNHAHQTFVLCNDLSSVRSSSSWWMQELDASGCAGAGTELRWLDAAERSPAGGCADDLGSSCEPGDSACS
jgi:hypothetical protein